jgi:hypothetical protein
MALVRMDKDEENVGELHGMNIVGEGGRTRAGVTRVMADPPVRVEARAERTWSVNGALVAMKGF